MRPQRLRQYLLLLVDVLVLFAALFAALWLRRGLGEAVRTFGVHARYFSLIFAGLLLVYYVAGFYDLEKDFDDPRFFGKVFWTSLLGALVGALYFYLDSSAPIGPRGVLALDAISTTALIWLWRSSYSRISRKIMPRRRVVFVGKDQALAELIAEIQTHPSHGYEATAYYEIGRAHV
jgi:FlaA1/EpsC-like NDP-sugar epimerase